MTSYRDIWLRKQRHSKAIISKNNAARELLLKQERPDIGDTSDSSFSSVPGPDRVYWREHQAEGYDPRLQWMQGENGQFYYDGRSGARSFSQPEGFLTHDEETIVINSIYDATDHTITPEQAARLFSSALGESDEEGVQSWARGLAQVNGGASRDYIPQIRQRAEEIRRDTLTSLARQGIYTTAYVNHNPTGEGLEEAQRALQEEPVEEVDFGDSVEVQRTGEDTRGRPLTEEEERELQQGVEEQLERNRQRSSVSEPEPTREVPEYVKAGIKEEIYQQLSPWGKEALSSPNLRATRKLWEGAVDVIVVKANDAVKPPSYTESGASVSNSADKQGRPLTEMKRRGGILNWMRNVPRGEFNAANQIIDRYNREVDAGREEGPKKKKARRLSFSQWMVERDKTFQSALTRAFTAQQTNKRDSGSYYTPSVANFSNSGSSVIGVPTSSWIAQNGQTVRERHQKVDSFLRTPIPSYAKVFPPQDCKEGSPLVSRSNYANFVRSLVEAWMNCNKEKITSPVKRVNLENWGFGENTANGIQSSIAMGSGTNNAVASIDANGEVEASITWSGGGGEYYVGSFGASAKSTPIYPNKEIEQALSDAISDESISVDDRKKLRNILRGWRRYGQPHPSERVRGQINRRGAHDAIGGFFKRFLEDPSATKISNGPLSPYVSDLYSRFGFVNGRIALRHNILWSAVTAFPEYVPESELSKWVDDAGNLIQKSFLVADTKKRDTIIKDNPLDGLQHMLSDLIMKQDNSESKEKETAWTTEFFMEHQGFETEEEYEEWLQSLNGLVTGPIEDED